MKKIIISFLFIGISLVLFPKSSFAQTENVLSNKIDKIVQEFLRTENTVILNDALYLISYSESTPIEKRILYFKILRGIEEKIDFNFNFNDRPVYRVLPSDLNLGDDVVIYTGMSPEAIKNIEAKEKYIKAIEVNKEDWRLYHLQSYLSQLHGRTLIFITHTELPHINSNEYIATFYEQAKIQLLYPAKLDYLREEFLMHMRANNKRRR